MKVVNCFIRNLSVFNGTHELTAFGSFFDLLIFTTTLLSYADARLKL